MHVCAWLCMRACVCRARQQCFGFECNNMGPRRGNAHSDGITGLKEVLEHMRQILKYCRWPSVYHQVGFHLKATLTDGFPRRSQTHKGPLQMHPAGENC